MGEDSGLPQSVEACVPLQRVALYGSFDVLDFGRLLGPHLVHHGLGPASHELAVYSPGGSGLIWADTIEAQPIEAAPDLGATLHIIGGGDIIRTNDTPPADYAAVAGGNRRAFASLWLGAGLIAAASGMRLAWNAPAVPAPIEGRRLTRLRDAILMASDYVSVCDETSLAFLAAPSPVKPVTVPDTTLDIARVWPAATLREHVRCAFARHGAAIPDRWLVFHVDGRDLAEDVAHHAAIITEISRIVQAVPALVALRPCYGDEDLARQLGARLEPTALIVDRPTGLKEMVGLLAHGCGYVGASQHGLVVALSYGCPAIVVAGRGVTGVSGFLDQVGMPARQAEDWHQALRAASQGLLPLDMAAIAAVAHAQDLVGSHWRRLRTLTAGGEAVVATKAKRRLAQWMTECPPGFRSWRAFMFALDDPDGPDQRPPAQAERPTIACNICGGLTFSPVDARCSGCGAQARHRAMRTIFDTLRRPGRRDRTCLKLGRNHVVAAGWFAAVTEPDIDDARNLDDAIFAQPAASFDVVGCIDVLERVPDHRLAVPALMRTTRPGGFVFLACRTVPGRTRTMDWGFPRGDRDGEYRMFGADIAETLLDVAPDAAIVVAEPVDPVTGTATVGYVLGHVPGDLQRLLDSDISCRLLAKAPSSV